MNWFDEQINERRNADEQRLAEAFSQIAGVVLGERAAERISDEHFPAKRAVDEVLKYYRHKSIEVPEDITGFEESLDYCIHHYGMMRREVYLNGDWYRHSYGALLGFKRDTGEAVALIPGVLKGYYYTDSKTSGRVKINKKTAENIEIKAFAFYEPFPMRAIGIPDLLLYMKKCLNTGDIALLRLAMLAVTLVGLILPSLMAAITGVILKSGRRDALLGAAVCVFCVVISSSLLSSVSALLNKRFEIKISMSVDAAMMMRLLAMPAAFYSDLNPGEMKSDSTAVGSLCSLLRGMVLTGYFGVISSLLYITQIFRFAPVLVVPSVIILLITVAVSVMTTLLETGLNRRHLEHEAKEEGLSYALITGVQKIRLAGAEKRAFAKWLTEYSEGAAVTYNPPFFLKISSIITLATGLVSNIVLYYLSVKKGVGQSDYFAFTAAFGAVMGAFGQLTDMARSAAKLGPVTEVAEPFLKTAPEASEKREAVTHIAGGIELNHVCFRYSKDTPFILDDLSLRIRPGEYVAVVGKTGCGKSTLIRLLLGFEMPEKGAVYYDGRDINTLDTYSLRRNIGTVLQNGALFNGDIYSNIVITKPELLIDDAWEAAEATGIADDIRAMPMGMHTYISEGQGGISGGQKQRLMIARAIAPKPKILLFDEATSALDNITQKKVSDALDKMGCTRVIVAHRLSTIKNCDRILVLKDGKIAEEGSYDELVARGEYFAELVKGQML